MGSRIWFGIRISSAPLVKQSEPDMLVLTKISQFGLLNILKISHPAFSMQDALSASAESVYSITRSRYASSSALCLEKRTPSSEKSLRPVQNSSLR